MEIDFFSFDKFRHQSEFQQCESISCIVQKTEILSLEQEGATITVTGLVDKPSSLKGDDFILMLKAVSEIGMSSSSDGVLGYVSLIRHDRPEDMREQLSGVCIEVAPVVYKRYVEALCADTSGFKIQIKTRFPSHKPTPWCAMGYVLECKILFKRKVIAKISSIDKRKGLINFE